MMCWVEYWTHTGMFVRKSAVKRNPRETITETRRRRKKKKR